MIEAAEFATPIQRELYDHYREIHLKFFPLPPVFPRSIEPPALPAAPQQPCAQAVLEALPPAPRLPPDKAIGIAQTQLRMKVIRRVVCESYAISRDTLMSARRTNDIVRPRHVYCYLASRLTKASLPQFARSLDQDHTTVMHAIKRTEARITIDREFAEHVRQLEARVRNQFGENHRPRGCIGRYVVHAAVADYFLLGWMHAANLNEYAALMIWPCSCPFVEPRQ
jgi:hypothetical protein